jgi:hypothetical protein
MGRLIVVLFLVVVGVGCGKDVSEKRAEDNAEGIGMAALGQCEVSKVEKWPPVATENPKREIPAGQTAFIFGAGTHMRARLHSAKTRNYILPLKELRNGNESLYFGVAPLDCWSQKTVNGATIQCVKCSTNVGADLHEPCCL